MLMIIRHLVRNNRMRAFLWPARKHYFDYFFLFRAGPAPVGEPIRQRNPKRGVFDVPASGADQALRSIHTGRVKILDLPLE
jgi:hypothetical protein